MGCVTSKAGPSLPSTVSSEPRGLFDLAPGYFLNIHRFTRAMVSKGWGPQGFDESDGRFENGGFTAFRMISWRSDFENMSKCDQIYKAQWVSPVQIS